MCRSLLMPPMCRMIWGTTVDVRRKSSSSCSSHILSMRSYRIGLCSWVLLYPSRLFPISHSMPIRNGLWPISGADTKWSDLASHQNALFLGRLRASPTIPSPPPMSTSGPIGRQNIPTALMRRILSLGHVELAAAGSLAGTLFHNICSVRGRRARKSSISPACSRRRLRPVSSTFRSSSGPAEPVCIMCQRTCGPPTDRYCIYKTREQSILSVRLNW